MASKVVKGPARQSARERAVPSIAERQPASTGRALGGAVRDRLERGFGRALDDVTVHDDATAIAFARERGAAAVTIGDDIYLADPVGDGAGRERLLAHETAHVLQQRGGTPAQVQDVHRYRALEREADHAADAALAGTAVPLSDAAIAPQAWSFDMTGPAGAAEWTCWYATYILPQYVDLLMQDPERYDRFARELAHRCADWITDELVSFSVDQPEVARIIGCWADTPKIGLGNYLDVLLDEIKGFTYHYDYGGPLGTFFPVAAAIGARSASASCLDLLFQELEGAHYRRLCELVDTYSVKYAGYRGHGFHWSTGLLTAFAPSEIRDRLTALQIELAGRTGTLSFDEVVVEKMNEIARSAVRFLARIGVYWPEVVLGPALGQNAGPLAIPVTTLLALLALTLAVMALQAWVATNPNAADDVERWIRDAMRSEPAPPPAIPYSSEPWAGRPKAPPTAEPRATEKPAPEPAPWWKRDPWAPPYTVDTDRQRSRRPVTLRLPKAKHIHADVYRARLHELRAMPPGFYDRGFPSQPKHRQRWTEALDPRKGGRMDREAFEEATALADDDRALIPDWSKQSANVEMSIDHIVELQLVDYNEREAWADRYGNLEALDLATNKEVGPHIARLIMAERAALFASGEWDAMIRVLTFDRLELVNEGSAGERWSRDDMEIGEHVHWLRQWIRRGDR